MTPGPTPTQAVELLDSIEEELWPELLEYIALNHPRLFAKAVAHFAFEQELERPEGQRDHA